MTLRAKLLLAQAPTALVLVIVGVISVSAMAALGRGPGLILKDNYRSVLAAERMLEAIGTLQAVALSRATGRERDDGRAAAARTTFEEELRTQEANITEIGEREATRRLRGRWTEYQAGLDGELAGERHRLAHYFDVLEPAYRRVQAAAGEILGLNQDAMQRKSERARRSSEQATTLVLATTVAALAIGIALSLALTARLLRPLAALAQTVRRIGEGDLEARAPARGRDEIAGLASEFNTMAERLLQYRQSSLGELLQAQQASQAAIDSLPDPVLVLDAGGALVNLNRAAEALLRVAPGVAPSLAALEPALREVVDRVRAHVVGGKGAYVPRGYEEAVNLEGGDGVRNLLPRATPLYSEEGGISGATLVLQDVSRLMRFDELKNDLVATVAHEFRTPLTSLRMAIHLCAEEVVGPLTPKQADLLLAARQDCERLQGIVDDLLDLSRIQAGRMALAPEPIPPRALLEEVAGQQGGQAESAGVALTVTAADDLPAVAADRERAQLVLSNLLANALRHTPRGGRVELLALPQDDSVRFEVADTGPGVPREYQERIFDKFFRVPGAPAGGVGLGLYVAREIVQAHGGEIGVLSDGPGSRFWFTLPQADAVSGPRAAAGGVGA